jgi:thiamine-phosphate pyrophosphorylase
MKLAGLYAITDERLTPYEEGKIFQLVEKVLKGGARVVQLRDKTNPDEKLIPIAEKLRELCQAYSALFIVNDRVRLAKEVSADGVHVGKDDEGIALVRKLLPKDAVVGVSCYADLERAKRAQSLGASYVAFGSFFPSPTKPKASLAPFEILEQAKKELSIPICAIGGITLEKAEILLKHGADLIAVISDLWTSKDLEERARGYTELFKKYGKL